MSGLVGGMNIDISPHVPPPQPIAYAAFIDVEIDLEYEDRNLVTML